MLGGGEEAFNILWSECFGDVDFDGIYTQPPNLHQLGLIHGVRSAQLNQQNGLFFSVQKQYIRPYQQLPCSFLVIKRPFRASLPADTSVLILVDVAFDEYLMRFHEPRRLQLVPLPASQRILVHGGYFHARQPLQN
ncbi:hypothetical protein N008_02485 [Hymenobacter sp. APR13]|nr:hypothetical protein N008_02485 [Hymenobacter sp. APR13]